MRPILIAAVLAAPLALLHAQKPPENPFTFTKIDQKLLEESVVLDRLLDSQGLVYHDPALERRLADLAAPLLPSAPIAQVEWKFHVLRDPMVNAFSLPNGSIYIDTGLLARAENDDQITSVLAHEVTHVLQRHAYIFNRSLRKRVLAANIITVAATWVPAGGWGAAITTAAANMSQFAIVDMVYGYSRQLEEEADKIGFERLKRSGRDPAQMVRMFQILDEKLEPEPVPHLLWDHPRLKDRIAYLTEMLASDDAVEPRNDPAYLAWSRPALLQNIQLDLDCRRFRSAVAAGGRLVAARRDDAVALYWLGESYRALGPRKPRLTKEESTDGGLHRGFGKEQKRTEQEDATALLATPEGRETLAANQDQAEKLLRLAAATDPSLPGPEFSLGALYEQQGKSEQAMESYRKCIELTTQPADRRRAELRLEELRKAPQRGAK